VKVNVQGKAFRCPFAETISSHQCAKMTNNIVQEILHRDASKQMPEKDPVQMDLEHLLLNVGEDRQQLSQTTVFGIPRVLREHEQGIFAVLIDDRTIAHVRVGG
jgi:hypothetical protein